MIAVVTGAAGFIGSTLSHRLLSEGWAVVGIDSLTKAYDPQRKVDNLRDLLDHQSFNLLYADLVDADLHSILREADVVFHLAGQASVATSWGTTFCEYDRNNVAATQTLLEACARTDIKRFVYASSSSVYGNAMASPTSESALPQPVSPYGVTKLAAEQLVRAYTSERGMPSTSLRLFTVFGPRQRPDMCFHKLVQAALNGTPFTVNGDGGVIRDFTYVDDVVDAFVRAAECDWDGVLNIGGGNPVSLCDAIDTVQDLAGPIDLRYGPPLVGDAKATSADILLANSVLGYSPNVGLRAGLEAMVAYAAKSSRQTAGAA